MSEVRFYHLTRQTAPQALPELLEKTLGRGWRAVVRLHAESEVEPLAAHLWTYRAESFLPHGTAKDGSADKQPIWITAEEDNPNGASVLFAVNAHGEAAGEGAEDYALVCEVFDGNDAGLVETARARWSAYKDSGHALTYWQQSETGWQKKSESA